jgi:hypothetical protein
MDMSELCERVAQEAALELVKGVKEVVVNAFCADGELPPGGIVLARKNPVTGEAFGPPFMPVLMPALGMMENDSAKDRFAGAMRAAAEGLDAFGVIFISEAWMLKRDGATDKEEAQKWLDDAMKNGVSASPHKVECVLLSLSTKVEELLWVAPIIRDEKGARLGPWEKSGDGGRSEGRFTGLVSESAPKGRA